MRTIIKIDISNVEVDKRYYSFDYVVTVNGKRQPKRSYDADYQNGDTPKQWKKRLEKGIAQEIVLERIQISD